jgi:hypothetical protein
VTGAVSFVKAGSGFVDSSDDLKAFRPLACRWC